MSKFQAKRAIQLARATAMRLGSLIVLASLTDHRPAVAADAADAADADIAVVEVNGIGATPDDAIKNAFRMAVQQAVGMLVDEKMVIENQQIISDQVLTYSNGFVHHWDSLEAPAPARELGGLYRTRIRAEVMRGELRRNLETIPALRTAFDGAQEWASLVSRAQSIEDGRALLIEFNKQHPITKLMVTRMIDETGKTGNEAAPRQDINVDRGTTTLHFGIQTYQNLEYYFTQYAPDLMMLLDKIADPVTEETVHKEWFEWYNRADVRPRAGEWGWEQGTMQVSLRSSLRISGQPDPNNPSSSGKFTGYEDGEVVGYRGYVLEKYGRKGVNPEQCRRTSGRPFPNPLVEAQGGPSGRAENMIGGMREPATTVFVPVKRNEDGTKFSFKVYDLRVGHYDERHIPRWSLLNQAPRFLQHYTTDTEGVRFAVTLRDASSRVVAKKIIRVGNGEPLGLYKDNAVGADMPMLLAGFGWVGDRGNIASNGGPTVCDSLILPVDLEVPTDVLRQVADIQVELLPW